MELTDRLEADLVTAAKARDEITLQVLRLLKSALQNYRIEIKADLSPQQMLQVLQREAKKRQDSIDQFTDANRLDLAEQETRELAILKPYLPKQPTEAELQVVIDKAITDDSRSGMSAMSKVISAVKAAYPHVDGSVVSRLAKQALTE